MTVMVLFAKAQSFAIWRMFFSFLKEVCKTGI